jgi:hypothetical protein
MKLSAGYVVFDGLETLEKSILSIRESVDLILVSYQTVSWGNTKCSEDLIPTLQRLKDEGLIDEILEFKDFVPSSLVTSEEVLRAKAYETRKRQSLLRRSLALGATHYLSMDADEFYVKSEFDEAKRQIVKEDLQATAVRYINYLTPTLHQGYSQFRVPFIYRIGERSQHGPAQFIFAGVDPTRGIIDESITRSRIFSQDVITMHHMEMVRKDLLGKYQACSRFFMHREQLPVLVEDIRTAQTKKELMFRAIHFGDSLSGPNKKMELTECEDQFGLLSNGHRL